jgi:hypothetical protein
MFLSVGHRNFIFLVYETRAMSTGQFFLCLEHCAVFHRQIHEITVSHRQKHDKSCFSDQATNEECLKTIVKTSFYKKIQTRSLHI